jgi:hypothetical protein
MAKIDSHTDLDELRRRQKGDRDAERNQEAEAIYRKDLGNLALPILSIFSILFFIIDFKEIPSSSGIGLLLLASCITYIIGFVLGTAITIGAVCFIVLKNRWRRRQDDRILNLHEDEREHLVHYAYGGDRPLVCRYIVLRDEVLDWAKQSGVKMAVLTTYRKQGDIPLVWFRNPEHAVAFKMRWY